MCWLALRVARSGWLADLLAVPNSDLTACNKSDGYLSSNTEIYYIIIVIENNKWIYSYSKLVEGVERRGVGVSMAEEKNAASPSSGQKPETREIDVRELIGETKEVILLHAGERYRLRITANDKLILTK